MGLCWPGSGGHDRLSKLQLMFPALPLQQHSPTSSDDCAQAGPRSQSNDCLNRVVPLAIWAWRETPAQIAAFARQEASLSHADQTVQVQRSPACPAQPGRLAIHICGLGRGAWHVLFVCPSMPLSSAVLQVCQPLPPAPSPELEAWLLCQVTHILDPIPARASCASGRGQAGPLGSACCFSACRLKHGLAWGCAGLQRHVLHSHRAADQGARRSPCSMESGRFLGSGQRQP